MNILDIILAIPLLWALYRGFRKGLVYMVASLTALLLGVLGAIRFHGQTGAILSSWFKINPEHLNLVAFAVSFLIIVLIVHTVAFMVDRLIKAVALGFVNRAAGMVFGLFVAAFVVSIVLMPLDAANSRKEFISPDTVEGSLLYRPLTKLAPTVLPYLKREEFRNLLPGKDEEEQQADTII